MQHWTDISLRGVFVAAGSVLIVGASTSGEFRAVADYGWDRQGPVVAWDWQGPVVGWEWQRPVTFWDWTIQLA